MDTATTTKPVHTLILDTGALIKNEPPISTLLAKSSQLLTVPDILGEIKDVATRSRVQTTLLPFLELRSPKPESVAFVRDFARRTGDLAVLSRVDLLVVALGYEVECERNGGDWRLRRAPGQGRVNGRAPGKGGEEVAGEAVGGEKVGAEQAERDAVPSVSQGEQTIEAESRSTAVGEGKLEKVAGEDGVAQPGGQSQVVEHSTSEAELSSQLADSTLVDSTQDGDSAPKIDSAHHSAESQEDSSSDSDGGGWITPSNLKKKQAQDASAASTPADEPKIMQVALLTTDFAMQNVILQINLNLLSLNLTRVKHLKTFVLRCHACFQVTKQMDKQFCPRCGQPALTRVSCSTSANGEFKLHLKKNMHWNHRGERYSVPKPVHGAANGRVKGGGKGGWGNELVLAEDQKEYQRAVGGERRRKERGLMDEDYLPGILTGERKGAGGRVKVGAGRNVNSRKR